MPRCLVPLLILSLVACAPEAEEVDRGYLVVTGADGTLTLIDPEGGELEVLSPGSGAPIPVQATASPDGSTLVWSDITDGGQQVVRVHDGQGTTELDIPTIPFYYDFSPEGGVVAALGNDPAGQGVALLLIDLTAETAELVEVGQPYYLDWSPDGMRLAVHVGEDVLGVVDRAGNHTGVAVDPGTFSAPAWTADGRIVAVLSTEQLTASAVALQSATLALAAVDPDDGSTAVIAELAEAAAFEVAGERVAYLHGDTGLGSLTVVGVDGSGEVEVAADDVVAFEWSPDGNALLFQTLSETSLVPHVWDGEVSTEFPGFVPTPMLVSQYLPFWAQYTRTITQWSPDSTGFAYAASRPDAPGQVRVQPLEGEVTAMGDGEMVIWAP